MKITGRIYAAVPTSAYLHLRWKLYKLQQPESFPARQDERSFVTDNGYSLKPFDDTRSIFIHIPKCAGVSVCRALYGNLAGGHTTLGDYLGIFEPECITRYFKYTIVRNPWDRLVSAYYFLKAGGFHDADKKWFDRELGGYNGFDEFVCRWLDDKNKNIWQYNHFKPQYHYFLDRHRKIKLDFFGMFENLDDDFSYIKRNITTDPDTELSKANTAPRADYMDYYSEKTKNIVANIYAEDIRLLGYHFDNTSLPDQLRKRARAGGVLV